MKNCYATGAVSASGTGNNTYAGGLIGGNSHKGGDVTIKNCYAAGNVSATGGTNIYAGGIIAEHKTGGGGGTNVIETCAALNQQITCSTADIGRIAGFSNGVPLTGNIAYAGTQLNGSTVTSGDADTLTGKNGLGKTQAELETKATWENLFGSGSFGSSDSAPWVWDGGTKRPKLYWE
jgi:hypothetical protein